MGEELQERLKNVQDFLSPVETWNSASDLSPVWLDKILGEKLVGPEGFLLHNESDDIRWRYVECGLKILKDLYETLLRLAWTKNEGGLLPADALSISQQQKISGLVQLVLVLGALPSFLPGVGLPVKKRTKFFQVLEGETTATSIPVEEKHRRLVTVVEALLAICSHQGLQTIILTRHTGDLLAALIQLSFAPLKKPVKQVECTPSDADFVMTLEKYDSFLDEQARFMKELYKVVDAMYQPTVVKYLLVLQSIGAREVANPLPKSINAQKPLRTPKWLQNACGRLLSDRLTEPNGLANVVRGILDVGHQDSSDTRKYHIISSIVSNPPSNGKYSELEKYFSLICPQVLNILDSKDETDLKTYHLIACACVRAMTERSLTLSRRYLLNVVMEPLLRLCKDTFEAPKEIVTTEHEMDECVRRLQLLFVVANDPSSMFVEHLRPTILALLQLHCKICFGSSHLKTPVEEIIKKFMRNSCGTLSMRALRSFAFAESLGDDGFRVVNPDIVFVNGDGGGIIAKQRSYAENEEQDSFYVSDDEKSIAIVDLLEFSKMRSMSVDFFLNLLKDLTEVMVEEDESDKLKQVEKITKVEALLEVERQFDRDVRKIRKRLMIIRLISLLSEDDGLQEAMMSNSEQKLQFLLSTIRRAAVTCKGRSRKAGGGIDVNVGTELQSVATAVSLLRHHVTQKNVKVSDWKQLQPALEDLKFLGNNFEDETVGRVCTRLRELIATHGAVMDHSDRVRSAAESISKKTKEMSEKVSELKIMSQKREESYDEAFENVNDLEVPVRGHGLIALTRLVESKDEECVRNINKVIEIFRENLKHQDTYIYLQSVKGIVACCSYGPEGEVVELLTSQYARVEDVKVTPEDAMQIMTKLGEALVQVTKVLGDLTPVHKNQLLNVFLGQLNHPDPLVRASSLSNVGEVCKNLRFELGSIIFEILSCLNNVISCDSSMDVRRAAVLVIVLLLEGLGSDALSVLQASIRDVWRTLVRLRNTEQDDVMRHHVTRALDLVDKIVRQFFQPEASLSKTIYVLDEPPKPL